MIDVAAHAIVGHIAQASPFYPNIAVTPGWKTSLVYTQRYRQGLDAKPPLILKTMDTGPITNHVNFASTPKGQLLS